MRKLLSIVTAVLLICGVFAGCGAEKAPSYAGTWYSDRDDEAVLVLNEDGTYTDGKWLSDGKYTVEGTVITLENEAGTAALNVVVDGENTTLAFTSEEASHNFYNNAEAAKAAREARQAAEVPTLENSIVGSWYSAEAYPLTFEETGKYVSFPKGKRMKKNYSVVSDTELSLMIDDGTLEDNEAILDPTGNTLILNKVPYGKANAHELNVEELNGLWYAPNTAEEYTISDAAIVNDYTMTAGGKDYVAFLSDTGDYLQLVIGIDDSHVIMLDRPLDIDVDDVMVVG